MDIRAFAAGVALALLPSVLVAPSASADSSLGDRVAAPAPRSAPGQLTPVDTSWIPETPSNVTEFMTKYVINDTYLESWADSRLVSFNEHSTDSGGLPLFDSAPCAGYDDPECARGVHIHAQLPLCDDALNWNCVAGVAVINEDGTSTPGTFARYVDSSGPANMALVGQPGFDGGRITSAVPVRDFPGDRSADLPPGGRVSLWQVPGVAESTHNSFFAADIVISGERAAGGRFVPRSFHAGVTPIVAVTKPRPGQYAPTHFITTYEDGRRSVSGTGGGSAWLHEECRYADRIHCLKRAQFPNGKRLVLDLRLSRSITGWLHGRLDQPDVDIRPVDAQTNAVRITGGPVQLPLAVQTIPDRELDPGLGSPDWWKEWFDTPQVWTWNLFADGDHRFQWFKRVLKHFADTSNFEVSHWAVRGVFGHEARCMDSDSELLGLVTTNAMMYSGLPPVFASGRLEYQVAGLHHRPDGSVTRGTYDLIMRESVAQCLYGLKDAPVTAEVSVVSEDGVEQVATTAVGQRDGWITMRAYGFTFSSPTIVVTLSPREQPVTLVCLKVKRNAKGPKRVVVKGTSLDPPSCPKGYRPRR
jgi:hypothetical protein